MSRGGEVRFDWAGEERTFRLAIGELRLLQEATDAGPMELLRRIQEGSWRIDDLREVLRLGLIGGGLHPDKEVAPLIRLYIDKGLDTAGGYAPLDLVPPASAVLLAALSGARDEPLVEGTPAGEGPLAETAKPEGASVSPASTDPAPS